MSTLIETVPVCSLCNTAMIRYPGERVRVGNDNLDAAWFCETCDVAAPPTTDDELDFG